MNVSRELRLNADYTPLPVYEGDEIYPNGIFNFNITRMYEHIIDGKLCVEKELINVREWFKTHFHGAINEDYLPSVDIDRPVIQAEIRPGMFEIIDGNHRMEKAYREGVPYINSYKLRGEQLVPYFQNKGGYITFVDYWNAKLRE
ncbi:hypothetical protein [Halobacillus trueperi]|uniref:ParB/Sulfiredoxin domain-containing protein n=1 Tax=Halobacillus trueperi TaxID=156205 RepID=A0A3E0J4S4_9BACI|nr:hypothetical protein [Halobacillus trueperi]REJ07734.1 hypothetical protein DYE48_15305 [Halobacillus trueperi]